eukprot:TRINITY_DN12502_c1_g1_i1.p1 TRINITY_DN12502_c1_g1~~TRINITY_DN12502_c1_g1_i1.p1  ORF type:complete len:222 (-),score=35.48 TRINITY_DN12502_c1_g1_i1:656-1321(-)
MFDPPQEENTFEAHSTSLGTVDDVKGLKLVEYFITEKEQENLLKLIDEQEWEVDSDGRRVQVYGYNYLHPNGDHSKDKILPQWCVPFAEKIKNEGLSDRIFDQAIIQEYQPGQGIKPHIDRVLWGDSVAGLSLGSSCIMRFGSLADKKVCPVFLAPRSLYILTGDSRYNWTHGIKYATQDEWKNTIINRGRRVSITFRYLNVPGGGGVVRPKRALPRITAK